jgi:hypothetical protein
LTDRRVVIGVQIGTTLGVHDLDLPALPPSALNDWGIHRVEAAAGAASMERRPAPVEEAVPAAQRQIVGVWRGIVINNGLAGTVTMVLRRDGRFSARSDALGVVLMQQLGWYRYADDELVVRYDNGWFEKDAINWVSKDRVWCECVDSNVPRTVGLARAFIRLK